MPPKKEKSLLQMLALLEVKERAFQLAQSNRQIKKRSLEMARRACNNLRVEVIQALQDRFGVPKSPEEIRRLCGESLVDNFSTAVGSGDEAALIRCVRRICTSALDETVE